jgi:ABC-2 type transport system ATP-binding protein
MNTPIISVDNLSKSYGSIHAVRGISFEIQPGEFFSLLGPNGAGKTTTFSMLSGLIEPSGGKIGIGGTDLLSQPMAAKRKMGIVPQSFAFYPTLDALENLTFFGRIYGLSGSHLKARITRVLNLVALEERARQRVGTYSNGMKRRLNIAIGLLHEPEILILDEPTVGIDTQSRNAILQSLGDLNKSGITVLYTTHHIEEAEQLCQRVAIMDQGEIIAMDTPANLVHSLGKEIVQIELFEAVEDRYFLPLNKIGPWKWADERKRRLHLETASPEQTLRFLFEWRETGKIPLKTLNLLEPSLESVFIHLTGRNLRD